MSVIPIAKTMSSAEFAKVREITPIRSFLAQNDDEDKPATVDFNSLSNTLYCHKCKDSNNCGHTARVELCGILTGTVNQNAKVYRQRKGANR